MNNLSKRSRFANALAGVVPGRKGECTPDKCSTLDGVTGAACCKLPGRCFFLSAANNCNIYNLRPINCRSFPTTPDDLALVNNCGYHW